MTATMHRRTRRPVDTELIALKADAMKQHVFHGAPLVSVETAEVIADAV